MKMQRLLFFCVILTFLFLPTNLFADTTEASAEAGASLDYHPYYESSTDKRGFPGIYKMDSSFTSPLHPTYIKEGWKFWENSYGKEITMEMINGMRKGVKIKHIESNFWATFNANNIPIVILYWHPQGAIKIGEVKICGKEQSVTDAVVMEGLYKAKKESGVIYVVPLQKIKYETVGKIRALGTAGVINKAMGPAGETDKIIGGGAFGGGIGTARSYVDENPIIRILCFDRYGPPPVKKQKEPADKKVEKKIKPEAKLSDIYFNFDKSDIIGQKEQLEKISQYVENNPSQIFWFIGSCDTRGSDKYNDHLGMERSKSVAIEVANILRNNGMPFGEIQKRVRYVSEGERHPDFTKHANNRRVYVISGKKITQVETIPEYLEIDK
ncbi:MAG: OmpA family protein [Patescibacteria group bacterium]|nr:OmpA family protein [Patescibacteria group bacterium]